MDSPIPSPDPSGPMPPPPSPGGPPPAPPGPPGPPPDAPTNQLSLDPNLLSKGRGENACKPGDTYETEITIRANDKGTFDVIDVDPFQVVDNPVGPVNDPTVLDDDAEEKALGYKRPKRSLAMPEMT